MKYCILHIYKGKVWFNLPLNLYQTATIFYCRELDGFDLMVMERALNKGHTNVPSFIVNTVAAYIKYFITYSKN